MPDRMSCYRREMPSPVGHMLGGVIAGWLVAGAPSRPATGSAAGAGRGRWAGFARLSGGSPADRRLWIATLAFAVLGALADADFLFGTHSTYSHSVGAVAVVALAAIAVVRRDRLRWALAAAVAYGSHILLDWMGNDTTPPIGIMALWPFTTDFYQSEFYVFMAISRRYWLDNFWSHNLTAVAREIAVLLPLLLATWWVRRAASSTDSRRLITDD